MREHRTSTISFLLAVQHCGDMVGGVEYVVGDDTRGLEYNVSVDPLSKQIPRWGNDKSHPSSVCLI